MAKWVSHFPKTVMQLATVKDDVRKKYILYQKYLVFHLTRNYNVNNLLDHPTIRQ